MKQTTKKNLRIVITATNEVGFKTIEIFGLKELFRQYTEKQGFKDVKVTARAKV